MTVLEASAGTGKTSTIAALAARYVAAGGAPGAPAAGHLPPHGHRRAARARRERLGCAEQSLGRVLAGQAVPAGDRIVAQLAQGATREVRDRHTHLARAVADFDAATILTTHGGPDDRPIAAFDRGGATVTIRPSRLAAVDTVHAMTIHESQGSQFATAAVLLPAAGSRILTRELLYTAVTRARERLVLVGSAEAVRAAVERASGLRGRLGVKTHAHATVQIMLTRRTQILLDETRHARLRERAERENSSVGGVIREAIDQLLDRDAGRRERLAEAFLAADASPVDDWATMERDIEGLHERTIARDDGLG